jgi:hypothetical protein
LRGRHVRFGSKADIPFETHFRDIEIEFSEAGPDGTPRRALSFAPRQQIGFSIGTQRPDDNM